MICDIDNIASYVVPHDSANVLGEGSLRTSIIKRVCLVGQKVKGNARWYFEAMEEGVDPAFHARVVVESIAVKIAKLRGIPLQGGASKRYGNVGFNKDHSLESYQTLKMLDKEYYVLIINVLAHRYYLTFSVCPIEMGVKVAQVGLIPLLCRGFWQRVTTRKRF